MDYIFWEFREKSEEKSEIFELYHLNSEHTPRTQCFNAPKMNYTLPEQTEVPKQTLWTVPFLSDIPDSGFSLKQALMQRRTSWNFSADPLTDQELETYIAYCFGINNKKENLKTYPSGGRLYPVEIYFIPTKRLRGKNKIFEGDYSLRYNVHTRGLELQSRMVTEWVDTLISATDIGSMSFEQAQFIVCLVGDPTIMKKKYHALTYRLMHNECGHIGQNMMLVAPLMGLHIVPLGGFFEERIRSVLEIQDTQKRILYVLAVG